MAGEVTEVPETPARWRDEGSPQTMEAGARRRRVRGLLFAVALLVGIAAVSLPYLRPPERCRLVPLFVADYRAEGYPGLPWRAQDRATLTQGEFFTSQEQEPRALDQARLTEELTALSRRHDRAIVVYLSAYARTDAAGTVQLLPSDADPDDPVTWFPLIKVLDLLRGCPARHKLLVLDLLAPPPSLRHPVFLEDVWACVPHDLDAVPDPQRLTLCAASPGQHAGASEVLGRSALGYYFTDGLLGRADADGDGRVAARELAAYVRARVARWARLARGSMQLPVLFGTASDFTVLDLPNATERPASEVPEDQVYPEFLAKAWVKSGGIAERERRLLAAERDWRSGKDVAFVKQAAEAALQVSAPETPPTPPARSLAAAVGGKQPSPDLVDALRQLIFQATARTRGLAPAKAEELRGQLGEEFIKSQKEVGSVMLARAAIDAAIADPRTEAIAMLSALVRKLEPDPVHVETLALARVVALGLSGTQAQQVLDTERGSEQAASRPRLFAWVSRDLEAAVQARHEAMVMLESRGYAPVAEAERMLGACASRTSGVLALEDVLEDALSARDQARAFLPACLPFRERTGIPETAWFAACDQAVVLAYRLDTTRKHGLASAFDDVRRQTALMRSRLDELSAVFTDEGIDRIVRAAGGPSAGPGQLRDLEGLLATILVPSGRRSALWTASIGLARRLEEDVLRHDRSDGVRVSDPPPPPKEDVLPELRDHARRNLALASVAGLTTEKRNQMAVLTPTRVQLATLERELRQAWKSLPVADPPTELWAWLADRYRYLAREYLNLAPNSPTATFYMRAARDYHPWLKASREEYAEVVETGDPPRLLPGAPITPTFDVRATRPAPLAFRLFTPGREWLALAPDHVDLPAPGVRRMPDGTFLVPVQISLRPSAGEGTAPPPLGMLAQVRMDRGRAYHRRIDVPLAPRAPELILSLNEKTPEMPLASIRLRVIPGKQPVFAYLRNPLDRPWNKVQVRLTTSTETRESPVLTLGPREVKLLRFPAPATPPPATPSPAPAPAPAAAGASPTPVPGLPLLEGPIRLEVLDLESKNDVIATREVAVDLADPVEYVSITDMRYDPTGGRNRLTVQMRLRRPMPGAVVPAELGFPAADDGGATYRTGTLQGLIPDNGNELVLFADGVSATAGQALFHVSVDGWARAFLFEVTLNSGPGTPRQLFRPAVRMRVGATALASSNFKVPLETDNAPPGTRLDVSLGRVVGGTYQVEVAQRRDSARDKRIGFAPTSPSGAMVFEASLQDWTVTLDSTLIRGERELRARLLSRGDQVIAVATKVLAVGDLPPSAVAFVDPPTKVYRMVPLALQARGSDSLVGVKEVNFFFGKPVDRKLPPGATPVPGTALNESRTLWGVKMPIPPDRKGPTEVSVQFVNNLGLSAFATTTVDLEDTDPAKTALATIKGRVVEGDRPQGNLTVYLSDEKRAERGRQTTKPDGTFEFKGVAPGKYRLGVIKAVNGREATYPKGKADFMDLAPGATETVELSLLLP